MGGLPDRDPLPPVKDTPGQRPPRQRPSLDRDPGQRPSLDRDPRTETPHVNRITDRCKNITFPQFPLQAVIRASLIDDSEEVPH